MIAEDDWKSHALWPFQSVLSTDGERLTGRVMRRKILDGRWQYRCLTVDEAADKFAEEQF